MCLAILLIIVRFFDIFDALFVLFIIPGFLLTLRTFLLPPEDQKKHNLIPLGIIWLSIGFFPSFIYMIGHLIPHMGDATYFFRDGAILSNTDFFKTLVTMAGYFLSLSAMRSM